MIILGALVNGIATVFGGVLGLIFKRRVSQKLGDFLMSGLGLCVVLVAVQGSIQTRSYTDSQNIRRKAFEVVADNVHFAEPKRDSSANTAAAESTHTGSPRKMRQFPLSAKPVQ